MTNPVCRIYTDPIDDDETLLDVMDACIAFRLPFYYSTKQRVIRAQSRSAKKIRRLERELRTFNVPITKTYCK